MTPHEFLLILAGLTLAFIGGIIVTMVLHGHITAKITAIKDKEAATVNELHSAYHSLLVKLHLASVQATTPAAAATPEPVSTPAPAATSVLPQT